MCEIAPCGVLRLAPLASFRTVLVPFFMPISVFLRLCLYNYNSLTILFYNKNKDLFIICTLLYHSLIFPFDGKNVHWAILGFSGSAFFQGQHTIGFWKSALEEAIVDGISAPPQKQGEEACEQGGIIYGHLPRKPKLR